MPSKPLLKTTQDFAFLSPRYGLENQKELKLPLLLFSQGGHGLKLGAVTMTMNTLALSTKAPHLEAVRFQGRHSPPGGQGQMNPNLTDAQKINPQSPGSLANPNPTSLRGFCQSNPVVHKASYILGLEGKQQKCGRVWVSILAAYLDSRVPALHSCSGKDSGTWIHTKLPRQL